MNKPNEQIVAEMQAKMLEITNGMNELQQMIDSTINGTNEGEEESIGKEEYLNMPEEKRMEVDQAQMLKKSKLPINNGKI